MSSERSKSLVDGQDVVILEAARFVTRPQSATSSPNEERMPVIPTAPSSEGLIEHQNADDKVAAKAGRTAKMRREPIARNRKALSMSSTACTKKLII